MKTSKEFLERLQNDSDFSKEFGEKAKKRIEAGETDHIAILVGLAAEYDYEITAEELDERNKAITADISDEELGKVAGGTTPLLVAASIAVTNVTIIVTVNATNKVE